MNLLNLVYGNKSINSHFQSYNNDENIQLTNLNHIHHLYSLHEDVQSTSLSSTETFKSILLFTNFENGTVLAKNLKVRLLYSYYIFYI